MRPQSVKVHFLSYPDTYAPDSQNGKSTVKYHTVTIPPNIISLMDNGDLVIHQWTSECPEMEFTLICFYHPKRPDEIKLYLYKDPDKVSRSWLGIDNPDYYEDPVEDKLPSFVTKVLERFPDVRRKVLGMAYGELVKRWKELNERS